MFIIKASVLKIKKNYKNSCNNDFNQPTAVASKKW